MLMITLKISQVCAIGSVSTNIIILEKLGGGAALRAAHILFFFFPLKEIKPSVWKNCPNVMRGVCNVKVRIQCSKGRFYLPLIFFIYAFVFLATICYR